MTTSTESATEASRQTADGPVTGGAEGKAPPAEVTVQAPEDGDDPGAGTFGSDTGAPLAAEPAGEPEGPVEPAAAGEGVTGDGTAVSAAKTPEDAPVLEDGDGAGEDDGAGGAFADETALEAALDAYEARVADDVAEEGNDTAPAEEPAQAESAAPSPDAEAGSHGAAGADAGGIALVLASLEEAAARVDGLTAKIDGIAADVETVTDQLNRISCKYELVSSEIESLLADNNSKNILSKTFLVIASVAVIALAAFQVYTFTGLISTQQQLNVSGRAVVENVAGLNKKMAEYDKNLTKALESSAPREPARHAGAEAAAVPAEKEGHNEGAHAAGSVQERVNRLRNGLPEKKLIRKETGDWFVFNSKKAGECIVDAEVIEVLNNAYRKSGRPLTTRIPPPPHNSLCLLKPDGKGGTEVVMTKDFVQ